ncbi:MAG: hypothetical protein MUO64_12880, partial [Anaerolineales bacterium]|nr:hypothetical protein [Anaerolineales bacterium]
MNKKPKAGRITLAFLLVILVLIFGLWLMKYAGGPLAAAGLGIFIGAIVGLIVGGVFAIIYVV